MRAISTDSYNTFYHCVHHHFCSHTATSCIDFGDCWHNQRLYTSYCACADVIGRSQRIADEGLQASAVASADRVDGCDCHDLDGNKNTYRVLDFL